MLPIHPQRCHNTTIVKETGIFVFQEWVDHFCKPKRGIDDVRKSTNNVTDKEVAIVLLTSITFSQFFNFRFKDWTKVMKLTESDVDEPSTECCSKSVRDCKRNLRIL